VNLNPVACFASNIYNTDDRLGRVDIPFLIIGTKKIDMIRVKSQSILTNDKFYGGSIFKVQGSLFCLYGISKGKNQQLGSNNTFRKELHNWEANNQ
jgi:hypothetical protein